MLFGVFEGRRDDFLALGLESYFWRGHMAYGQKPEAEAATAEAATAEPSNGWAWPCGADGGVVTGNAAR